jgi:twitching motility protein PilT
MADDRKPMVPAKVELPPELASVPPRRSGSLARAPSTGKKLNLSQIEFTDLYFSEMGQTMVRGTADTNGPLVEVPDDVLSDLHILHAKVCNKGQTENEFMLDYDGVRYRCSKIPSVTMTWYALRRAKVPIPRLGELKLELPAVQHLGWLGNKSGLVLIAGATGDGKTTTACALLQEYLLTFGNIAVTVEDPPELPLEGEYPPYGRCFQLKVENGDFASAMRATMRYMPRYILLGEVRDPYGASQALSAAINGHLVITTIHAGSVVEALQRLLKYAAVADESELARQILSEGLAAVVHQKLRRARDGAGGVRVSILPQFLFIGAEAKIRTKIREGKFEQLGDDIEQQRLRMAKGDKPVELKVNPNTSGRGR